MAMSAGGGGGVKAEPNVTPMIDVMLVLLIIFMVVAPALLAGFNATPPQGQNLKAHPTDENSDQTLGIDKDGKYYINKQPIRYEDIQARLTQIYQNRTEDKVLYVKADRSLDYAKVLDALDIAAKAGVAVTGMITDQTPGTTSTVEGDVPPPPTPGGH
ncbi:MAG: biopolymer transporter ExbD [Gemmatimonadaceae bacterium]|nr:biopolymer transporter ExbD [Gemmatimonadaceae bacterium]NUQ92776.1 biopolymer transporter ExbD [Gemmatimonadaceae bacterium]NUR19159.1 biopolymer transporter ExbD [Gemmatimonadaceae bacterium]